MIKHKKNSTTHQLRHPAGNEGDGQDGHEAGEGQLLRGGQVPSCVPVGGGGAAAGGPGVSAGEEPFPHAVEDTDHGQVAADDDGAHDHACRRDGREGRDYASVGLQ